MINAPGVNVNTGQSVAIKLEHNNIYQPVLYSEAHYCRTLAGGVGIPQVYWDGDERFYYAMAFELLGPSLEDLFNFCGRRFSLKTVLLLADQILHRIEFIHSKNIVHADIQPGNLLMGLGRSGNTVYLTDFGIARGVVFTFLASVVFTFTFTTVIRRQMTRVAIVTFSASRFNIFFIFRTHKKGTGAFHELAIRSIMTSTVPELGPGRRAFQ